jgi:ABC-type lipoprotein release transport system permease subunit
LALLSDGFIEFVENLRMSLSTQGGRGQQLGNYKLISLLRAGSFAQVYLGEHVLLNTQSAIKGFWLAFTGFCLALSGSIRINRTIQPSRKIPRKEKVKKVGQHA